MVYHHGLDCSDSTNPQSQQDFKAVQVKNEKF